MHFIKVLDLEKMNHLQSTEQVSMVTNLATYHIDYASHEHRVDNRHENRIKKKVHIFVLFAFLISISDVDGSAQGSR